MTESSGLSFGIMCESTNLSTWQAKSVLKLLENSNIKLKLLIVDAGIGQDSFGKKFKRIKFNRILFLLYTRFLFKPYSNTKVDMSETYSGIDTITCKTIKKGKFSEYFSKEDLSKIDSYNLDFVLRFGFNIIRGEILNIPKYGVWSFHHDDEMKYRGSPPCFWEIYENDAATGAILQRLTDRLDGGVVLKKGFLKTNTISYSKNVNEVYLESAYWPDAVCKDILNNNAAYLQANPSKSSAKIYYHPTNFQFIFFLFKLFWNILSKVYERIFLFEDWNIGVVKSPISAFIFNSFDKSVEFVNKPDKNIFIADPFGLEVNNKLTFLFEEYDYNIGKGIISSLNYDDFRNGSKTKPVFDFPFHLSYPYLFRDNNTIYCIPESAQSGEVCLYKAISFPEKWEKVTTLFTNIKIVDPTICKYQDRYWLFYTTQERNCDVNLFISYAETLEGPWLPHLKNPVKTDIRSSRPGGTPFITNNTLYRPAQNCSITYGGSVSINQVISLTQSEFEEQEINHIYPFHQHYKDGLHTVSEVSKNFTILDSKRHTFIFDGFKKRIKKIFN